MSRARSNSTELKVRDEKLGLGLSTGCRTIVVMACVVLVWFNISALRTAESRRLKAKYGEELMEELMKETLGKLHAMQAETEEAAARGQIRRPEEMLTTGERSQMQGFSLDKASSLIKLVQESIMPPPGLDLIVVTGVKFILERDFPIWDRTFTAAKHQVIKTTKKRLMKGENSNWKALKCLDLFDGKSHCIEPKTLLELHRYQRVSRLYGLRKTLWNKDRFCETMNHALTGFEGLREFVFPCWMLPNDYKNLIQSAKSRYLDRQFILKPTDRGEGNGIIVMDSWKQLVKWKSKFPDNDEVVVQTYLPNPFLITERKWDMRTYVLVTSIHPLRAYMFRDGLVRFASSKYEKSAKGGGKATSFLTNTSVNKKNGVAVEDLTWPFPKMYRWLKRNNFDPDMLWSRIESAVTQMLLSAEPSFSGIFQKLEKGYTCVNCYQLLGVDVIVDDEVTPRVIEVNGEPSMQLSGEVGSQYDYTKTSMARDLVALVYGQHDVSERLASDLMDVELDGNTIGFQTHGCTSTSHDFCLSKEDMEYLVEMKREEVGMGGFRRIYPSRVGDQYSRFIKHLSSKFPKDSKVGSYRLHTLATSLAKLSRLQLNNAIDDPNYQEDRVAGQDNDRDDD